MEEKKQHEECEKHILNAEELEEAVARFSEEAQNHPESKVDMEEVEKITAAFKGVSSNAATVSMAIVATVLEGSEIMILIAMFKKALSLAVVKTLQKLVNKND